MTDAQLAVIGAGPKGLAIAAEAWALRRSGAAQTPRVVLVDSCGVAANWDGRNGYTDGRQRLGTAPDKDLGFPFAPSWGRASPRIDAEMREVTWAAHVQQGGRFAECIDRRRPQPTRAEWQRYSPGRQSGWTRSWSSPASAISTSSTAAGGSAATAPADGCRSTAPGS